MGPPMLLLSHPVSDLSEKTVWNLTSSHHQLRPLPELDRRPRLTPAVASLLARLPPAVFSGAPRWPCARPCHLAQSPPVVSHLRAKARVLSRRHRPPDHISEPPLRDTAPSAFLLPGKPGALPWALTASCDFSLECSSLRYTLFHVPPAQ